PGNNYAKIDCQNAGVEVVFHPAMPSLLRKSLTILPIPAGPAFAQCSVMPAQPERLLRYRFDTVAQARKHLHPMEGRQLLFFPDPFLDVRDGQSIQLELCFTGSEQTLTVRGLVHSVETGALRGAWLDLYSLRIFDGMSIA